MRRRDEEDEIARAVVSGQRGFGRAIDGAADYLASLMKNRLAALGAGNGGGDGPSRRIPESLRNRRVLENLLRRVGKHLEHKAATDLSRGDSEAR